MRYQIAQSKINNTSWYVDDTQENKTVAICLAPDGKHNAESYADFLNRSKAKVEKIEIPNAITHSYSDIGGYEKYWELYS